MNRRAMTACVIAAVLGAGCAVGPAYQRPAVAVPPAYKEAPPAGAPWLPAAPADGLDRGAWWLIFGDPALNALLEQVEVSNQNVAAAAANYAQAQALVREQRAALFPALALDASSTRTKRLSVATLPSNQQLTLRAGWEPDLWGGLSAGVDSATASAEASAAKLAAARLSAQAALATDYFALRQTDHQIGLLDAAASAYERALQITTNQYNAGIAQRTDVLQAQTQLENTRADRTALVAQRALLEHAIALLVGKAPAELSIASAPWLTTVPAVPLALPAQLLQRRPDIAAAERAVAAANAQIGIARSAYFPGVTLTAAYGSASSSVPALFNASNAVWSLGLAVAQTIFDAGATTARVDQARAAHDAAVANYRQTVLTAFQAVEDQLATIRSLAGQEAQRRAASAAADRTEQLIQNQYLQAQVPYTTVVIAQISALNAREALSQLMSARQAATVALIAALGGGWQAPQAEVQAAD